MITGEVTYPKDSVHAAAARATPPLHRQPLAGGGLPRRSLPMQPRHSQPMQLPDLLDHCLNLLCWLGLGQLRWLQQRARCSKREHGGGKQTMLCECLALPLGVAGQGVAVATCAPATPQQLWVHLMASGGGQEWIPQQTPPEPAGCSCRAAQGRKGRVPAWRNKSAL